MQLSEEIFPIPWKKSNPHSGLQNLSHEDQVSTSFSKDGSLLATGHINGQVILWDFFTRNIIRKIHIHTSIVASIDFNGNGTKILTTSCDRTVKQIDTNTGLIDKVYHSPNLPFSAQFYPQNEDFVLISLLGSDYPILLNFQTLEERSILNFVSDNNNDNDSDEIKTYQTKWNPQPLPIDQNEKECVLPSRSITSQEGKFIFCAYRDKVDIFERKKETKDIKHICCIKADSPIHSLDASSDALLIATGTEIFFYSFDDFAFPGRVFEAPKKKNLKWLKVSFGLNSNYIIAGTSTKKRHSIYIYNLDRETIEHSLSVVNTTKSGIRTFSWNPIIPFFIYINTEGEIFLGKVIDFEDHWGAFDPGFEEIEENIQHIEDEEELDFGFDPPHFKPYLDEIPYVDITSEAENPLGRKLPKEWKFPSINLRENNFSENYSSLVSLKLIQKEFLGNLKNTLQDNNSNNNNDEMKIH